MARRIHHALLGISLLGLSVGALFNLALLVGAFLQGFSEGFLWTDIGVTLLLLVPLIMSWVGWRLFFRLYGGWLPSTRRYFLIYHGIVAIYGTLWLVSTFQRDGSFGFVFPRGYQLAGVGLLLVPLFTTLCSRADAGSGAEV